MERLGPQLSKLIISLMKSLAKNPDKMIKKKEFIDRGLTQFQVSAILTQNFVQHQTMEQRRCIMNFGVPHLQPRKSTETTPDKLSHCTFSPKINRNPEVNFEQLKGLALDTYLKT